MKYVDFCKLKWKFSREAYKKMEDGRYMAIGDLNDGRGLVISIRDEEDLPTKPTGQILISIEL